MKPKPYRKTKPTTGSNISFEEANHGGGKVEGVIKGPKSSIGDEATQAEVEQVK